MIISFRFHESSPTPSINKVEPIRARATSTEGAEKSINAEGALMQQFYTQPIQTTNRCSKPRQKPNSDILIR